MLLITLVNNFYFLRISDTNKLFHFVFTDSESALIFFFSTLALQNSITIIIIIIVI